MAVLTKNLRTVQSSASNAAAATTTSSGVDLTTALGGELTTKITNGATGPTVACTVFIEISGDNSAWKAYRQALAGTANAGVYEFSFPIPKDIMYVRTRFTGNTAQAVTVEAFLQESTSFA